MRQIVPKSLQILATACPKPLYVVGGSVRDFLAGLLAREHDWDICSPLSADEFVSCANACGFTVKAVYRNTGTVKLHDSDGVDYEYSCFRSDKYIRGTHVPVEIFFTEDICLDARRRDFTVNAIYYDIAKDEYVDPLGGIAAVKEKRLTTVDCAKKVFGEDGLRLMRLARQAAQLGFSPDEECFLGAKENAALIVDISPERIFAEFTALLCADKKYGNTDGPYQGLKLLDETGVLDKILPELTLGRNMAQRADFHKYDVLEHSLRAVKYASENVRLAALLHDVGKPFCTIRDGHSHEHATEGARIAKDILTRLKASKKQLERIPALIQWHMYDFDCQTGENKLRRFFISHYDILDELLAIKQADFSACTDDCSIAPTCKKWTALLDKMRAEKAPLTLKDLAISGADLQNASIQPCHISEILKRLLLQAACNPTENEKERLLRLALSIEKELSH